jgi:hypothetical protein
VLIKAAFQIPARSEAVATALALACGPLPTERMALVVPSARDAFNFCVCAARWRFYDFHAVSVATDAIEAFNFNQDRFICHGLPQRYRNNGLGYD